MFELRDPLAVDADVPSTAEIADLIAAARKARAQAECDLLVFAGWWADAHDPWPLTREQRVRRLGAAENHPVSEFAPDELGALLHTSGAAAAGLMADVLDLRGRLPDTWDRVKSGTIRPFQAREVAQATRHLDPALALRVDQTLAPCWGVLPWTRVKTLLDATIIDLDPDGSDARTRAAEAARYVRVGRANEYGLKVLVAKAAAGDVIFLMAMINRLAEILAADGDADPVEVRRAKAIGLLANPAHALQLLITHTADTGTDSAAGSGAAAEADAGNEADPAAGSGADPGAGAGAGDASVEDRPAAREQGTCPEPVEGHPAQCGGDAVEPASDLEPDPPPDDPEGDDHRTVMIPGRGDRGVPDWLAQIDWRRLRPTVKLHVHLTGDALAGTPRCPQVARIEDAGPVTLAQVQRFVANPGVRVQVQPVLDPADVAPVGAYEIPTRTRDAVRFRHLVDTFPYGLCGTRSMDLDHTIAHAHGDDDDGGPTAPGNLSPLTRHHHRAKTIGGWGKRQPDPDTIVWRSPHGWIFIVTPEGTLDLGRTPYARAAWNAAKPSEIARPADSPDRDRGPCSTRLRTPGSSP